uniref:Uncharacterized protein n=2 Tax=Oryza brachyantha TaxID=4533 RepID=J3LH66_ORYBR
MVQELTGFPAAAIFRPLPRRVPVHAAHQLAAAHGCDGGSGGAVHGHSSDASAASVPAAQLQQCSPPGVFDGLPDLGSPEFDSWPDLSN